MFKVGSIVAAASLADALSLGLQKPQQQNDCEAPQLTGLQCVDIHKKSGNDGNTATLDDLIENFHTFGENKVQVMFAANCGADGFLDGVVTGNFDTGRNFLHGVMGGYCRGSTCGTSDGSPAEWIEVEVSKSLLVEMDGCEGKSPDTCTVRFSTENGTWPWQKDTCSYLDKIRHVM